MTDQKPKIEKNRISILGCGWLGFPLAQRLLASDITTKINGSTTSLPKLENFKAKGINGYLLELNPGFENESALTESFFNAETLIISLPPRAGKNGPGFYVKQMEAVISEVRKSPVNDVVFISSTGIYPELNRIVTEDDVDLPEQSASEDMVTAEVMAKSLRLEQTVTILRLGGLLGYNRIPGKYVTGKKDLTTGGIPVNYIHRDDAIGVIMKMLEDGLVNETFNIVAPLHPLRREIYETSCAQFGWKAPEFAVPEKEQDFKIISGEKLNRFYNYDFKFPDPVNFFYSLEDHEM
ncbi:NAD-dependent dehydratase [Dyadobacter sediminis]|uniref:NAD-dependent dehydratase n=1 Tax=Dyadobacter sediminis TaxID=1493691 RepID=A0A5R9K7Y3_9BACT|nr:NAD-dependent dehydratase [Dyadobacter sediminis]TLU89922.1 NAD-dependent dehydratase [Dyadobacter sediminis]GGC11725.1 NAD(P)-dependent oxidoreductase [Dyadobacter sediminis]